MEDFREEIKCPKCKSEMIDFGKTGYSAGKAVAGVLLTGGIGLLAGFWGKNKIKATCLSCGNRFDPKDGYSKIYTREKVETIECRPKLKIPQKKDTQEDIEKKILTYNRLLEKGLITKDELNKKIELLNQA